VSRTSNGPVVIPEVVERLRAALDRYADGVHTLGEPATALDADLPPALAEVYRVFDGADLFHEALILYPASGWTRDGERLRVGEMGGDALWVDVATGAVWRLEEDTGEWLAEGTRFDRWLWGWIEAEAVLYDRDGEFRAGVIDPRGDLSSGTAIEHERRLLRRDRSAASPRWRLARALARAGNVEAARRELEEVVEQHPGFGWAWYDLARLSEALGELGGAREEALAAAEADPHYEHAGFFLGWAARLAVLAGDEAARAELAERAQRADQALAKRQLDGARASLEAGEVEAARELVQVALAVEPRHLGALDLKQRIEQVSEDSARSRA
jgi:tetratricopeptide (TPR) repeat protein